MIAFWAYRLLNLAITIDTNIKCKRGNLLGVIPPWYKYVKFDEQCSVDFRDAAGNIDPNNFWLVGFGVIDILLRIAGIVAVGFVIYGGFRYITSQGEPENLKTARNAVINALIGVAIAVLASALVSFFAGQFR